MTNKERLLMHDRRGILGTPGRLRGFDVRSGGGSDGPDAVLLLL